MNSPVFSVGNPLGGEFLGTIAERDTEPRVKIWNDA
jgi:hypothetical protein